MDISVIIVNYNVKFFLEQCLLSVQKALKPFRGEIIVADNLSTDGSLAYLQPLFPDVQFINNPENLGFGKACNQCLRIAKGKYILFLNPDTLVPEDCFEKCIAFLESHPDAGALGIRMLDGSGKFLPESKRAFPSPLTSLFKLSGLSSVFPHSKWFGRYHLGYLSPLQNHEVDVLSGAFMMIPRQTLDQLGAFDEVFFMYGEDVDLSYRIQQSGKKNYYFAESSIIHFKGESTRKGSLNYVRMFYKAMSVFVNKHYGSSRATLFNFFIQSAIRLRAMMSAAAQLFRWVGVPIIDALLIFTSFLLMKLFWYDFIRPEIRYNASLLAMAFPAFTALFWLSAYYSGLYDAPFRYGKLVRSYIISAVMVLAVYSLLPEALRFSRAIVVLAPVSAYLMMTLLRQLMISMRLIDQRSEEEEKRQTLIVGSDTEYQAALHILRDAGRNERVLGRISATPHYHQALGHYEQLPQLLHTVPVKEIIFCEGTLSFRELMNLLPLPVKARIKFFASGSHSIIGSDSKNSSGEFVSKEKLFALSLPEKRRGKRLLDVMLSVILLASWPLQCVLIKKPLGLLQNIVAVLAGRKTWVGYALPVKGLPPLYKGVLTPNGKPLKDFSLPEDSLKTMDYWYATDYEIARDIECIGKGWSRLGS